MTTAQVFANGVQLGSPSPGRTYLDQSYPREIPGIFSSTLNGPTGAVPVDIGFTLIGLVSDVFLPDRGAQKTLRFPRTIGAATSGSTTWFLQTPLPSELRPTLPPGESARFVVPVVQNGAAVVATVTLDSNGAVQFHLPAPSPLGQPAGLENTSIAFL